MFQFAMKMNKELDMMEKVIICFFVFLLEVYSGFPG